jgi:hypothetical protein
MVDAGDSSMGSSKRELRTLKRVPGYAIRGLCQVSLDRRDETEDESPRV